jgi:methionine synthase II (cobalamin-independent)
MLDFSEVLKKDINELASAGYDYVQLTEALLCNRTSTEPVSKDALSTFRDCIQLIFRSFGKRSALYFHSGDASPYLSDFLDLPVTDIGFDFNTPPSTLRGIQFDKNLILGLQNTTRKLPPESLANEPRLLAARSKSVIESLNISDSHEVFVSPSQDFDGVQTYPQAETRIENLANAVRLLNEGKA